VHRSSRGRQFRVPETSARGRRAVRAALALVVVGFMAAPLVFWDRGIVDTETTFFIQHYLGGRSLLRKVFDPRANDLKMYQARELSYFIDYLDAQAFRRLLNRGVVLLIPASGVAASLVTVVTFFWGIRRVTPGIAPLTATLILLVYVTNFVYLVTLGVFYRSSKPLVAATLLVTLFYVAHVVARRAHNIARPHVFTTSSLYVFALTSIMSLLDRQGFFYTVVLAVALGACFMFRRPCLDLLAGAVAAIWAMLLYNLAIGPAIIHAVNGYWPSFEYQQLPAVVLLTEPHHLREAAELVVGSTRVLLGSFPIWAYLVGAAAWLLIMGIADQKSGDRNRESDTAESVVWKQGSRTWVLPIVLCTVAVASQVLMFALMIVRHPQVYAWPDHRLWYYPLPYQAALLFGLTLLVGYVVRHGGARRVLAVNVVLVLMVVGNITSWREHRGGMLRSPWFPTVYYQSAALKESLRDRRPALDLNRSYEGFYEFCVRRLP